MPIFLINPMIQAPLISQITPPPLAGPELPSDDPSVFNLTHPWAGFSHQICFTASMGLVLLHLNTI